MTRASVGGREGRVCGRGLGWGRRCMPEFGTGAGTGVDSESPFCQFTLYSSLYLSLCLRHTADRRRGFCAVICFLYKGSWGNG